MRELKTGYAYHGNRMPQHVEADLQDMVSHNANLIVHVFSHTDWDRLWQESRRKLGLGD